MGLEIMLNQTLDLLKKSADNAIAEAGEEISNYIEAFVHQIQMDQSDIRVLKHRAKIKDKALELACEALAYVEICDTIKFKIFKEDVDGCNDVDENRDCDKCWLAYFTTKAREEIEVEESKNKGES
jgi:hypothetical protein